MENSKKHFLQLLRGREENKKDLMEKRKLDGDQEKILKINKLKDREGK